MAASHSPEMQQAEMPTDGPHSRMFIYIAAAVELREVWRGSDV